MGGLVSFAPPGPRRPRAPHFRRFGFLDQTVLGDSWGAAQFSSEGPSIYAKSPYAATLTWGGKEGSRSVLALGISLTFDKLRKKQNKTSKIIKTKPFLRCRDSQVQAF
uniref:Uncharacterized protein n=1 Tax=Mus musculus TaxID=10090 RepID=Q3UQ37_MOUSE|nr:unnamed protein product [Mus musculus]